MKKKVAMTAALIIGIGCWLSETVVMAEEAGDKPQASGMNNLQIPQKMEIVIDPWEMDGREQIYSETYVIKNGGDTAGTLTLSNLACKPGKSGEVIIRTDRNGLHDNEERALYMEMWFGDSDHIVMSEQETEYQAELKPGEELKVHFTGEVNENASEDWANIDVRVAPITYSWNMEELSIDEDIAHKESAELEENTSETEEGNEEENIFYINKEEQIKNENVGEEKEENRINKVIELLEEREADTAVDYWKVDADHQITSAQYIVRNAGEKTGIFSLKDIVCLSKEGSGIAVKAAREEVQDADEKSVFMEMVSGNGDKATLTQTGSEYKIELKPGEEVVIQFDGAMNEKMFEEWEEGCIVVDAVYSWENMEEK